ncbi:tail fiber domain-containing protein [Oceanobacillus sp. FSL H7-0719]|uniref:tail fiber domain-containing protein n=1 Tax=Oceanobacillus sp. FSL H7-0719 TaxID=2954507 RepID=UPI003252C55F
MLDIPNIYGDPIVYDRRKGSPIDPYRKKKETVFIETNYAILSEIPNRRDRVKVSGLDINWVETDDRSFLEENYFWVDYTYGHVYFHGMHQNKTIHIEYTGEGVRMLADSRVYYSADRRFPNLRDKLIDVDRAILVERNRITEQIVSHPQPSEIVDLRVDYNGKVYDAAKHRVDAEQQKIEEAYIDAKGIRHESLKKRIDSLQLATEESLDEQETINTNIWAEINLIPGKITLETGMLEEKINGELTKITSRIDLIPSQIQLEVQELKEYTDGEFSRQASTLTMLSNKMELKVDVNGIVSSINLSEEGVRIDGAKNHITGETKIDNAVIKSANIESLSASKLRTGILRSENDHTTWNLNTGELTMASADITMGSGANIRFTDSGNKIVYTQLDPQTKNNHTAGFGVGRNINQRFPFSYFGTARGNTVAASDSVSFTGFIANTDARTDVDNIGNSVVGDMFHIRDRAVSFDVAFRFDLTGSVKRMHPINTGRHTYDLGADNNRFRNLYVDNVRSNGSVNIRDSHLTSGWLMQTRYANDGSAITLRGLNGGTYNYSIGGRNGNWERITTIRLKNKPNVSSDRRLKKDIAILDLGLDFMIDLNPSVFRFKKTNRDMEENKLDFGFIAQEVREVMDKHGVDINEHSLLTQDGDGMYALEHEQFIAPMVNSIKELNNKDIDKDRRIKDLEVKVRKLEEQLASA